MGSFTMGNVSAGRDVNLESNVNNDSTITINYGEISKKLEDLASSPEDKEQMKDLGTAIQEKDEGTISKIIETVKDNIPLITGIAKTLAGIIL